MLEPQRQAGSNLSFLSIGRVRKGRLHLLRDGRRRTGGAGDEDEAEDCDDGERHQVLPLVLCSSGPVSPPAWAPCSRPGAASAPARARLSPLCRYAISPARAKPCRSAPRRDSLPRAQACARADPPRTREPPATAAPHPRAPSPPT